MAKSLTLEVLVDLTAVTKGAMRDAASALVRKTAFDVEGRMKTAIMHQGSGKVYGHHQASAPGEPPATDTGTLAHSVRTVVEDALHAHVAVGAEYAIHLELGTKHMAPRPFAVPAVEETRPEWDAAWRHLGARL